MRREKINTRYVVKDNNIRTGLAFARLNKKGDPSYLFYKTSGPQTRFSKTDIPASALRKTGVFHVGSWYSYNEYTFQDTLKLLRLAKKENAFTTYDPNWREGKVKNKRAARARIKRIISAVDLLKLSKIDAMGITGSRTLSGALKRIGKKAIVTLGEKGSFYWDGKKKLFCPPLKIRVVDTIGAGDGFMAGLIYKYCKTGKELFWEKMKENLTFASALSALICTAPGATAGVRNLDQTKNFIRSNPSCGA
jgi:fructokinase